MKFGTKIRYINALLQEAAGKRHEAMLDAFIREVENEMYGDRISELRTEAYNIGLPSKTKDV